MFQIILATKTINTKKTNNFKQIKKIKTKCAAVENQIAIHISSTHQTAGHHITMDVVHHVVDMDGVKHTMVVDITMDVVMVMAVEMDMDMVDGTRENNLI